MPLTSLKMREIEGVPGSAAVLKPARRLAVPKRTLFLFHPLPLLLVSVGLNRREPAPFPRFRRREAPKWVTATVILLGPAGGRWPARPAQARECAAQTWVGCAPGLLATRSASTWSCAPNRRFPSCGDRPASMERKIGGRIQLKSPPPNLKTDASPWARQARSGPASKAPPIGSH